MEVLFVTTVYHASHKIKYRLESFLLIASVKSLLPKHLAFKIKRNRFVNLSGGEGKNLVIELYNRIAKQRIANLGPNHTADAVMRIGRTVSSTNDLEKHMCIQTNTALEARNSKATSNKDSKDFEKIIIELKEAKVFEDIQNRTGRTCNLEVCTILRNFKPDLLLTFIEENKIKFAQSKAAF